MILTPELPIEEELKNSKLHYRVTVLLAYQGLLKAKDQVGSDCCDIYNGSLGIIRNWLVTYKLTNRHRINRLRDLLLNYSRLCDKDKILLSCVDCTLLMIDSRNCDERCRCLPVLIAGVWQNYHTLIDDVCRSFINEYQYKIDMSLPRDISKQISDLVSYWKTMKKDNGWEELRQAIQILLDRIEDEALESDIRKIDFIFPVDDFVYCEFMIPRLHGITLGEAA